MNFGEIIFYIFIGLLCLYIFSKLYKYIFLGSKVELEYNKKLKASLDDEFIIDPESGARLTLEEAESGHWIAHDNEFKTVPESEIDKLYTAEDKNAERTTNYLKEKREYRKQQLTDKQIKKLEKTKILSKYDEWSYSSSYRIECLNGFVFLPLVKIKNKLPGYFESVYQESQIMFWLKLDDNLGH